MNILVYAGPEAAQASLKHTIASLRSLLASRFAVQPISPQSLVSHPWTASCSLLVFPQGRAPASLPALAVPRIQAFVENGGAFLAFAVGADSRSTLDEGNTELFFFDKVYGTPIYPKFRAVQPDSTPELVAIQLTDDQHAKSPRSLLQIGDKPILEIGPGAASMRTLAKYIDGEADGQAAALCCHIGAGKAILCGPNLEYPMTKEEAAAAFMSPERLAQAEEERKKVLWDMLRELGLELSTGDATVSTTPLPQFLTAHPTRPRLVPQIMAALGVASFSTQVESFQDTSDTFRFHSFEDGLQLLDGVRNGSLSPSIQTIKHVIVCTEGKLPAPNHTPLFDLALFYETLSVARSNCGLRNAVDQWGMGEVLLYGEIVTSTQTMLDK